MNINSTSSSTSSASTNRITGLATGLDVDSLVKSSMQPYQAKVDKQIQQKEILEIKQKLYRDVMSEGKKLYDKYFDPSKSTNIILSNNYSAASFDSNNTGVVTAKGVAGAKVDNYTVQVDKIATGANTTLDFTKMDKNLDGTLVNNIISFNYNGNAVNVDISSATDNASLAKIIDSAIGTTLNMKATYSQFAGGVVVETNKKGGDQNFSMSVGTMSSGKYQPAGSQPAWLPAVKGGTYLNATFTNSKGKITYGDADKITTNTVTMDNVQFTAYSAGAATLTGKTDVSGIKDKITNFINDYNTYIEKLNKLLNDKRDRTYQPLTADQKKEMSESEITLWNQKVETGQLRRDDDISRIENDLRNSSIDPVKGSSLYLEKIGITPSNDYGGNEIGTFSISDEGKLTEALQNDPEGVMNLLIGQPDSTNLSKTETYNQSGIFYRMKDIINNELILSNSSLSKKAGLANGSTVVNNELTKSISKYETKIKEMQTDLTRRQQALYTKYSKLETVMNKYNSQQSYLSSQLGVGI